MARPFTQIPSLIGELFSDAREVLFETASRVRDRMRVEGKPIEYPVRWDSIRQKRFVIAKLRREGNLPYQRTHRSRLSWQATRYELGARLSGLHPVGAVGGLPSGWQSRIHRGRWPYLLEVLFEELQKIPADLSNKFSLRSDR
jgi:hypothetical protein